MTDALTPTDFLKKDETSYLKKLDELKDKINSTLLTGQLEIYLYSSESGFKKSDTERLYYTLKAEYEEAGWEFDEDTKFTEGSSDSYILLSFEKPKR